MLSDYRQEKWFTIFTDILTKTVQSSILAAAVNDFVTSSFEALSPTIKIGIAERTNILENLWKVFNVSFTAAASHKFSILITQFPISLFFRMLRPHIRTKLHPKSSRAGTMHCRVIDGPFWWIWT